MAFSLNYPEFVLLRDLIQKESGIAVEDNKMYLIEGRLLKILVDANCTGFSDLYVKASSPGARDLRNRIVDAMTTNETLWLRDSRPFDLLKNHFFPLYDQEIQSGKRTRVFVWSAAASTGQEAYSVAMMAHECARQGKGRALLNALQIYGTDISSTVLDTARLGEYDSLAMSRGLAPDLKSRYFRDAGAKCVLSDEVRKMARFEQFNLMNPFTHLNQVDIVLLRNVAIYFSQAAKIDLFKRIAKIMAPNGILIIGASETLMGYSNDFDRFEIEKCPYYQLKP
ncbi:MAG: protein-glutamate O-methyltransferase CheR [Vampirovibrionales bacterium]|nr:protein-glutamate O-methyltransferase CheR [Vampirovibrionales bacterium]